MWKSFGQGALSSISSGLIGGAVDGFMDRWFNGSPSEQFDRQLEYNRSIMDYQAQLNREQFDYEYKKQSPKAIREQLEKAGLNPALMYGGSSASGIQASIDGVGLSSLSNPHNTVQANANPLAVSQLQVMDAQAKDLEASANLKRSQAKQVDELLEYQKNLLDAQGVSQRIQNDISSISLSVVQATSALTIEEKRVALDEAFERLNSLKYDNARKEFENSKMEEQFDLWKEQTLLDLAKTSAEIIAIDTGVSLTEQEILHVVKDRELLEQVIKKTELEGEQQDLANQLLALENEWARANKWLYFLSKMADSGSGIARTIKTVATKKPQPPRRNYSR